MSHCFDITLVMVEVALVLRVHMICNGSIKGKYVSRCVGIGHLGISRKVFAHRATAKRSGFSREYL